MWKSGLAAGAEDLGTIHIEARSTVQSLCLKLKDFQWILNDLETSGAR